MSFNFNNTVKDITNEFNLSHGDVIKVVHSNIEQAILTFREEISLAENAETLEFLRRNMWNRLFAERGAYFELCKRSPMLRVMRLKADIRYSELFKQKKHKEDQQITFQIVKSHGIHTRSQVMRAIVAEQSVCKHAEMDGELSENEIIY